MSTDYAKDRWIEGRQKLVERQDAQIGVLKRLLIEVLDAVEPRLDEELVQRIHGAIEDE